MKDGRQACIILFSEFWINITIKIVIITMKIIIVLLLCYSVAILIIFPQKSGKRER